MIAWQDGIVDHVYVRAEREVRAMPTKQLRQAERAADYLARRGGARDREYGIQVAQAIQRRMIVGA